MRDWAIITDPGYNALHHDGRSVHSRGEWVREDKWDQKRVSLLDSNYSVTLRGCNTAR